MDFEKKLLKRASAKQKIICFPEAMFSPRIIEACGIIAKNKIAKVVLVGDETAIKLQNKKLKDVVVYNPKTSELTEKLAAALFEKRKQKGMTEKEAAKLVLDPYYFATMLVECGVCDGLVGGCECSTANLLRPALQVLKNSQGKSIFSYFLMSGKNRVTSNEFFLTDCGLLEFPTSEQLASFAEGVVEQSKLLTDIDPRVAFLSYSTTNSANSESVTSVQKAFELFKMDNSKVKSVGEVQFDSAMIESVARHKIKGNADYYGKSNILVFPDINAGNIGYKAISYFGNIKAIGPITCGFSKPANDLSRGCTVKDIVLTTAVTVLQCK